MRLNRNAFIAALALALLRSPASTGVTCLESPFSGDTRTTVTVGGGAETLDLLSGGMMVPAEWFVWFKQPQFQNFAMDASGEALAFVFQVPKTGNIHKVGFRTGSSVTTSDTLRLGLYRVLTTSGVPDTTAYGGMTAGTQASLVANTTYTVTLGADAAAVVGDIVALVIEFNSYVAGNLMISGMSSAGSSALSVLPYVVFRANTTSGSWTKQSGSPVFWIEYDDGSYAHIPISSPYGTITGNAYSSVTTPDEYALTFSLNFQARLSGVGTYVVTNTGPFNLKLYEVGGATTTLLSVSSATVNPSSSNGYMTIFQATNTVTLAAGHTYRLSMQPTTTTSVTMYTTTFPSANAMNQTHGGQSFYLATTTDGAAWTETTNQRPLMSLILDQF